MHSDLRSTKRTKSQSIRCQKGRRQNQKQGSWEEEQIEKFMVFLHFNQSILSSKLQRRSIKIFKQMSAFIGTRSSIQCRSQNQKLTKKHKNLKNILKAYQQERGKDNFREACRSYQQHPRVQVLPNQQRTSPPATNSQSRFTQTQFSPDSQQSRGVQVKVQEKLQIIHQEPPYMYQPSYCQDLQQSFGKAIKKK